MSYHISLHITPVVLEVYTNTCLFLAQKIEFMKCVTYAACLISAVPG